MWIWRILTLRTAQTTTRCLLRACDMPRTTIFGPQSVFTTNRSFSARLGGGWTPPTQWQHPSLRSLGEANAAGLLPSKQSNVLYKQQTPSGFCFHTVLGEEQLQGS